MTLPPETFGVLKFSGTINAESVADHKAALLRVLNAAGRKLLAEDHRITAKELSSLEKEFGRLNIKTSRSVLEFYQTRKHAGDFDAGAVRQPALAMQ